MQHLRKLLFIALATLTLGFVLSTSQVALAQGSPDLVISQVYGGAGCGTVGCSTFKNDFIEIYNRGTMPVSLNGLSVQYSAQNGTTIGSTATSITPLTNFTLQPGQYYLIAESFSANGVSALPTPNTTGSISMSATVGKVFLATITTPISLTASGCPATPSQVKDFVGYGSTPNCFEGAGAAPAPSTTTADIRNGGGSVDTDNNNLDFTAATPTPRNSLFGTALKISEFRTFGPTGTCDEFIEIYNASNSPYTVQSLDAGSLGFAVAQSNGNVLFIIENTKVIPARGHYLAVNNGGGGCTGSFSGSAYPAGSPAATATGDDTMNEDIPTNAGIALFNTSNQGSFNTDSRLDAVGPNTLPVGSLYVEGTGYPPINPAAINIGNHTLFRDARSGVPKDTNNNETDFFVADTNGATVCTATANFQCQRLGAPGPENTSSPVQRNDVIKASLVDTQCASISVNPMLPSACRFERRTTPGGSPSSFGTISIRRRFKNNTQQTITRLRFRIVDITTIPDGQVPGNGVADLRAISSTQVSATCQSEGGTPHACTDNATLTTTIEGTTLETDANGQPNGGAYNSTLSLATSLAAGASINVQFLLGVERNGFFRFFVNVEALPAPAALAEPAGAAATKTRVGKAARAAKGSN